jgi:hypothetical protein
MRTAIVLSFVVMAGVIAFMFNGQPVGAIAVSTPHPYATCEQSRNLVPLLHWHLEQYLSPEMDPEYVKQQLIRANIAADYPYDWCLPRYAMRGTLDFWQPEKEVWAVAWLDMLPLPPKRPRFYAKKKPRTLHASVTIPVKVNQVQPPPRPTRGTHGQNTQLWKIPSAAL